MEKGIPGLFCVLGEEYKDTVYVRKREELECCAGASFFAPLEESLRNICAEAGVERLGTGTPYVVFCEAVIFLEEAVRFVFRDPFKRVVTKPAKGLRMEYVAGLAQKMLVVSLEYLPKEDAYEYKHIEKVLPYPYEWKD